LSFVRLKAICLWSVPFGGTVTKVTSLLDQPGARRYGARAFRPPLVDKAK